MADPITDYYADNPWEVVDKNQRSWLDPDLIDMYRQKSIFRPLITFTRNLGDVRATQMTVTQLLGAHADTTPLSARQIWMPAMHLDSRAVNITFQHNGAKVAYHKYDDMISYWKLNGKAGLRAIVRGALGQVEVDMNDLLARNALISGAQTTGYTMYAGSGATDFNTLGTEDVFDPAIGADIWLGMANRGVAQALGPNGAGNNIVCFTSPGVIYDIQKDTDWIAVQQYQGMAALMNYEVGSFKNVRYVQNPKLTLWNCGAIIARAPISASHTAGDGAPDPASTKVDGTYYVGQGTNGITHYLQLGSFTTGSLANLAVNDIITIHKTVTSAYGVTNGVDFTEGTLMNRRIVSIDVGNGRICLDQPIMMDYNVDLGGGTYGYITKGRNIHASIFVGAGNALVAGVAQTPQFYELDPIDDYKAIFRFTFDQYLGYQPFQPEVFEVVFSAGSTRVKGAKVVQ